MRCLRETYELMALMSFSSMVYLFHIKNYGLAITQDYSSCTSTDFMEVF